METRLRKTGIATALFAIVAIINLSSISIAAEFSADLRQTMPGQKSGTINIKGKIAVKGKMQRKETTSPVQQVVIVRQDKNLVWILAPKDKSYSEVQTKDTNSNLSLLQKLQKIPNFKKVGTGRVAGYVCDKYTFNDTKNNMSGTVYISSKLKHELKVDAKVMGMDTTLELSNIKEGKQAASLFSIPKGYKKAAMPPMGMPGMGRKGTPKTPGAGGRMPH